MRRNAPRVAAALGCGIFAISGFASGASGLSETAPISQEEIDHPCSTPTELTFWTWVPDIQNEVDLFEEAYPAISVTVENVGQGAPHYQQLRTVLLSGQGVLDVVQMEYQYIPSLVATKSLLDLTPYGAAELEGDYVPWVWEQVAAGGGVWSIPQDTGPMGNLYRADILEEAGVTDPPTTWEEYAAAAEAVRNSTDSYISNIGQNQAGQLIGLLWQAGGEAVRLRRRRGRHRPREQPGGQRSHELLAGPHPARPGLGRRRLQRQLVSGYRQRQVRRLAGGGVGSVLPGCRG